jgi:hypothetical protein
MAKAPQSNLPPQAQPWGRYIEGQLAKLSLDAGLVGQDSNNTLAQLNSSIQLLSRQQSDLASQQATLASQQATLASQQTALAAQQAFTSSLVTKSASESWTSTTYTRGEDVLMKSYSTPSLTLTRNAWVVVSASSALWSHIVDVGQNGWPYEGTNFTSSLYNNGSPIASSYSGMDLSINVAKQVSLTWFGNGSLQAVLYLGPGTYTFTHNISLYMNFYEEDYGYAQANVSNAVLTASVIG